jgi:hypothetical protein
MATEWVAYMPLPLAVLTDGDGEREIASKKKNVESLTTKAFSRSSKSSKNESRQSLVILPNHFFPNVSSQTGDAPRRASHQLRGNMGSRNGC